MKLGKLFKAFVNVVELPIELSKDVFTMGNFGEGTYTKKKIEEIEDNLDEVTD